MVAFKNKNDIVCLSLETAEGETEGWNSSLEHYSEGQSQPKQGLMVKSHQNPGKKR